MEKYSHYTVEDFTQDSYFRQWVLEKSDNTHRFWKLFCETYPTQTQNIEQAKSMVLAFNIKEIPVDDADIQRGINRIMTLTDSAKEETPIMPFYKRTGFRVAASLALLISMGLWWINSGRFTRKTVENTAYTEGVSNIEQSIINTKENPAPVTLPDGSTVILEKNSQLRFQKDFKGSSRTVYLVGEALFDVVKNPNKPFVVYAGDLVTKVLGTSFRIKAMDKGKDVVVNVIRGRVSVYADKKDKQKDPEMDGLILTPNQKVVFTKVEERLKRTLVEKPLVIIPQETLKLMVFEEAPVGAIFKAIEEAYGVEIMFDDETLKNCALTTTLRNETLFEKLTVICKSIGATYKVVDAQVIVEGEACH
jgi:transmembrane sensor